MIMRLFTAIPVPDEVKQKVTDLARGRLPIPYINTTNLHITLNFLGELTDDECKKVFEIFPQLVGDGRKKISIVFDKIVNFRQQIHITLKENSDLTKLQNDLERGFRQIGFYFKDREYYPHVKLGNMHLDNVMNRQRKLINFPNELLMQLDFMADKAALFESKLLLHHAHHRPLIEVKLI